MASFPNCMLFPFLSGAAVQRPQEVIAHELNKNKDKLLAGLSGYGKQTQPSGEWLEKEKKLEGQSLEFVKKLSLYLGLNETLCYDLFVSYLAYEYRSSKKCLQQILSNDRHSKALIFKMRDFYFMERLYLLRCLKQVLSFGIESQHPYKVVYTKFVDSIGSSKLIASIQDQYEAVCDQTLPSHETHGTLMTGQHTAIWAKQNLQEQCELLELMVVYLHSYEPDVKKFIPLFEKFKRQGFAQHQTFKRILDQSTDELLKRLGYLQVLVILGALDFELIQRCHMAESFDGHPLLKDKQTFQRLDELFEGMGGSPFHGPLLMSWVVVRDLYLQDDENGRTKKMGNTALRLKCFECLCDLLNMEPFKGTALIASIAVFSVYMMLYSTLIVFQEDTLGDPQNVSRLCELVMAREFIADHFWERGMEDGLGTLYHSALTKFPMQFPSFMQQSIALASAGQDSAKKVLSHIQRLQVYTEYLDRDSTQDLTCVGDMLWRLTSNKYPYGTGSSYPFVIPKDTLGTIYRPDKGSPVVQWAWTYNGWNLFMCEIEQLLQQLSHGAGMVTLSQIGKVTQILSLIKAVLTSDPGSTSQLEGSCSLIYHLIQRCARLSSPPLELLANSLDCLSCVAQKHPLKVWHGLKQTGLLPFLTIGLDNMTEILSGQGLQAGLYGSLLAGHECLKGTYPLTQAYLGLLTTMVKPLRKEKRSEELLGSVLFILREVFPVFHKWRYYDKGRREVLLVGQKCVDLFHRILDFFAQDSRLAETSKSVTLERVCVRSLLFTEAGKALLDIISTGVGNIDVALSEQSSAHQGPGIELVQLTRLGFSILNRLLLLKSPDLPMSPVENALSSQPAGRQHLHIVVTIGQYVFHRYDPRLTTIATLLLKRLAVISPMSILACLGTEAEPIRDMYLMRLQAITEDVRLKVAILELLTACVQTQPGLIELFLNIQSSAVTDGKKDLAMGKISCLQTVLDLVELKRQGTYRCPPVVLCACVQFVHALWAGLRETAMAVLRTSVSFWSNIVAPLMKDLPEDMEDNEEVRVVYVRSAAYVMKILAQEFYSVPRSKLDKTLHKVLEDLNSGKRLQYWSQCVGEALSREGEGEEMTEETLDENPSLQLLSAWKNLLITTTTQSIEELKIDESLTQQILSDLMTGLRAQFVGNMSEMNVKLASVSSALYFTLVKAWRSTVKKVSAMLKEVELALVQTCTSSETLIPSVQVGLLGSALALLQQSRQDNNSLVSPDSLCTLLAVLSPIVQQTTYQLHCQPLAAATPTESAVTSQMDIKLKLEVTGLCLMCEIIDLLGDYSQWLPVLQQHTIISSLLAAVQKWMKGKEHPQCVQAALMLFLKIAQSEKGAEYLNLGGLTEHTCLHISTIYRNEDLVSLPSHLGKVIPDPSNEEVTWSGVYGLCIDLYSTMLHTLRFSFLKGALDFVGIHQDRLQQVLELARFTLHEKVWREAKKTCTFIFHLSNFIKQWRFELPKVLDTLLTSMCYMCQTLVSLLIRPQYLQYLLEHQSGGSNGGGREKGSGLCLSRPQSLQSQGSTEDVDQPSSQLVAAQIWMFEILGMCLSTLRHFSPGLCEVMLDMSLDISEWSPFLQLSFSTPSVDQEAPPTFGTLIAVVTVCVQHLLKTDTKAVSPHKSSSDTTPSVDMAVPKSLVQFVMESSLYILLSQSCRYLKDPDLPAREKQLLKRELGTELNDFLTSYHRYLRRGGPPSPGGSHLISPGGVGSRISVGMQRTGPAISRSISSSTFTMAQDQAFFKLVQEFVRKVLR